MVDNDTLKTVSTYLSRFLLGILEIKVFLVFVLVGIYRFVGVSWLICFYMLLLLLVRVRKHNTRTTSNTNTNTNAKANKDRCEHIT